MQFRPLLTSLLLPLALFAQAPSRATRNVVLVMSDGLRWQEAFSGVDPALINKQSGVSNPDLFKLKYWRDTPQARRQVLMPFLWSTIAEHGQIYGNRDLGSDFFVTNGLNFSYPGYSETFCGFADSRVDSNDKNDNPNVSVLEWLAAKPEFRDRIAAFGAWDLFPYILNIRRSGLTVNAGYDPLQLPQQNAKLDLLNRIKRETGIWDSEALDAPMFHTAMEYVRSQKPRVLFVGLGDTDEWAHAGKYELYIKTIQRVDGYIKELWETLQSMPEYRGNTTLIVAVDHGRGVGPVDWKGHGEKLPDSKYTWLAVMGPDTAALGERAKIAPATQSQIAATLAALLGHDYAVAQPKAGKPIADVLKH